MAILPEERKPLEVFWVPGPGEKRDPRKLRDTGLGHWSLAKLQGSSRSGTDLGTSVGLNESLWSHATQDKFP